jgi:hypothetical protein
VRYVARDEKAPSQTIARNMLLAAGIALGAVGVAMNGWFAQSLGATEATGWLFFAVGVASDVVAFSVPSCSAKLWQARQRATSLLAGPCGP